ncbi:MAG: chemotaxis response regulator protein-glutamate methylesterase [Rhodocyclaceae bacterium]|nr:chemotaxis response regulator protein-glutamate methylesterase [Rhodocyclaceae bacterium]
MTIKVLVIDDSALMRGLLTEIIGGAADLQVVGAAPDAIAAREMIKTLDPDVLTLDVEMPKMDGLEFLSRLMRLRPMPVVMVSSHTERGSEATLRALETGAVDFMAKPRFDIGDASAMHTYAEEIRDKIRAAHGARLRVAPRQTVATAVSPALTHGGLSQKILNGHIIAIGASTGGTEAIKDVLSCLPAEMPGIVMVQHMPEAFTASFAKRLDSLSSLQVREAQGGERIEPGTAWLAPGHSHLRVRKNGGGYVTELTHDEPVNRHRPAADVLFRSVAEQVREGCATGVILTGMGKDGAQGLLEMKKAGDWNIGQDQESCVVYGMPREAAMVGAIDEVAPLSGIAGRILAHLRHMDRT